MRYGSHAEQSIFRSMPFLRLMVSRRRLPRKTTARLAWLNYSSEVSSMHAIINQKREAAGKKPRDLERVTIESDGLPVQIDGVRCQLLSTFFEAGINHKKIIDAVLKPLGYAKAKGKKDSYEKQISENESLTCFVGVPAMWRVRELYASMGYCCGDKQVDFRLLYWGVFHRVEWQDVDNMDAMMLTTERTFRMAIENVGFLVSELEVNCLGEWRKALGDVG